MSNSIDTHNTARPSIIDPDSIHIDDDNEEEAIALTFDNRGLEGDTLDFTNNNNNNNRKVSSLEQSIPSLQMDDDRNDIVSNDSDKSREKLAKKSKDERKKDKNKRHKKEKKDKKKHKNKDKKQRKATPKTAKESVRATDKEDKKLDNSDEEHPDNLSGVEMERDVTSYNDNDFDNDDNENDQPSNSAQDEDIESENINSNNDVRDVDNDDNQADSTTLIRQVKEYYEKIKRVFIGKRHACSLKILI